MKLIYLLIRGSPAVDPVIQRPGKSSGSVSGSGLKTLVQRESYHIRLKNHLVTIQYFLATYHVIHKKNGSKISA